VLSQKLAPVQQSVVIKRKETFGARFQACLQTLVSTWTIRSCARSRWHSA
jgi:hypothetical protein